VGSRWPQALVRDPQAVPCEELCLGGLTILRWPVVARSKRIGGGSVRHAWLTEPKRLAGPSAPSLTTPHVEFDLTPRISQRAEQSRCARPCYRHGTHGLGGAVFPLKTGAEVLLGIITS
jgi:hypothetical protein